MKLHFYRMELDEQSLPMMVREGETYSVDGRCKYNNPEKLYELAKSIRLPERAEEYLYMACLDGSSHCIGLCEVSHGTVNSSLIGAREVFQRALLMGAVSIILIHNHPSSDTTPSNADIAVTRNLVEAGKLIGVPVLDHLIVGRDGFTSLREEGYFKK